MEPTSFDPKACLVRALDLIQEYSIQNNGFEWFRKKEIDWDVFREETYKDLKQSVLNTKSSFLDSSDAETEGKFCEVVRRALAKLGDNHSEICHWGIRRATDGHYERIESKGTAKEKAKKIHPQKEPEVKVLESGILHLTLHGFNPSIRTDVERTRYQNILQNALLNTPDIRGVIVDLTKDYNGGTSGPMVRGLSPLLGPGSQMLYVGPKNPEGYETNINNDGGPTVRECDRIDEKNSDNFPHLDIPVAVLQSKTTASAFEKVTLSFHGRKNTMFFGEETAGMTSGNNLFSLTTDEKMQMCVCQNVMVNRDKTAGNGAPIQPDVETNDPLKEAKTWLKSVIKPEMKETIRPVPVIIP